MIVMIIDHCKLITVSVIIGSNHCELVMSAMNHGMIIASDHTAAAAAAARGGCCQPIMMRATHRVHESPSGQKLEL
eukprot:SAG11_NODE_146_length_14788_cov_5.672884_7_plen_76_part_00